MARRYDSKTTTFSPEGRLYQVEYAMESVSHAGAVIGILAPGKSEAAEIKQADERADPSAVVESAGPSAATGQSGKDTTMAGVEADKPKEGAPKRSGIVLAAEKRVTSKLLDKDAGGGREKIFEIDSNTLTAVAGITADANSLVNYARNAAQNHLSTYNNSMPIEQLVRRVSDLKQGYTQYGGLRPFGVSFLFAGWDPIYQFQLYTSDPSGNYTGWKASCIGANSGTAQSLLRQEYKDDMDLDAALKLAVETLSKSMDATSLDSEKVELAVVSLHPKTGRPFTHILQPQEIDAVLKKHGLAKKPETAGGLSGAQPATAHA